MDYNVLYRIEAVAEKDGITGKTVYSDEFLSYKVTQFDTLPKIAAHYGIPLSQLCTITGYRICCL